MIKALVSDFSKTLMFAKDASVSGSLNQQYRDLKSSEDFAVFEHFFWNQDLLTFYQDLQQKYKLNLYIFTNGKMHLDPEIYPYIQSIFSKIFTPQDLANVAKTDPKAYRLLAEKLHVPIAEILFIDDTEANVNAAKAAGLQAVKYQNVAQVSSDFLALIS